MAPPIVHLGDIKKRSGFFTVWERQCHSNVHWLVECFAESLGVFFLKLGVGSTAPYVVGNILKLPGLSSLLQIGFAYAFGILMAITVCTATSGGHFNPCVTIAYVIFQGFPPRKAVRYIIAQILGAYIGCLLVYAQWRDLIVAAEGVLTAAGELDGVLFTPSGPAGIFGLYVNPGTHLGRTFLNEFVTDFMLALVIWGAIDPTNVLVPPAMSPWLVSFAYAVAIWGFATPGLAANSARDLGGRFASMTLYGVKGAGGAYAAIAALTNIPATLLGAFVYEVFLTDSDRVVSRPHVDFLSAHKNHRRNPTAAPADGHSSSVDTSEKGHDNTYENVHSRA